MTEASGHTLFLYRLARALHEARGWQGALSAVASELSAQLPGYTPLVFLLDPESKEIKCVRSPAEGAIEGRTIPSDAGDDLLVQTLSADEPRTLEGEALTKDALAHLEWKSRKKPSCVIIAPLRSKDRAVGALELVAPEAPDPGAARPDTSLLKEIGDLLGTTLSARRDRERRELGQLEALTRMTQLYDIGRTFHSTLEMEDLAPLVADRIANLLRVEQCNVWLLESDGTLCCASASGPAAEAIQGALVKPGEGVVGRVAETGKEVIIGHAPSSALAAERPEQQAGLVIDSIAAAPMATNEIGIGVVEVLNRLDSKRFTRADLPFLRDLASQAAIALNNARLLKSERKLGALHALLEIGREATSTLDLTRVLAAIVNRGSELLPYHRAAIGLREKGRIRLAAVSGKLEVDEKEEEIQVLARAVDWAASQDEGFYLSEISGKISTDLAGAGERFSEHFKKSGMKSFIAVPLSDEEGKLGVLTMESTEPYFLSESQLELTEILALQASSAIRNAKLYRQVPLISVMEPWIKRKEAWSHLPLRKRLAISGGALALLAVLTLVPWPIRVAGEAEVMPHRRIAVSAEVEGTVARVLHREGDSVREGETIAVLQDFEDSIALAEAMAELDIARREKSRLEARQQFAPAQMEGVKLVQLQQEVALLEKKMERTHLRAPAHGIILTPRIQEKVGAMLYRGDVFCHLADAAEPTVEIRIPETEIAEIDPDARVWVKVAAYPSRTFRGMVFQVGARALETEMGRYFTLRARLDDGSILRPGMSGEAKVLIGTKPVGYALFRRPARWTWAQVWPWLP